MGIEVADGRHLDKKIDLQKGRCVAWQGGVKRAREERCAVSLGRNNVEC